MGAFDFTNKRVLVTGASHGIGYAVAEGFVRAGGGVMFLIGALIMVYNVWRTIRGDVRQETKLPATATAKA